MFRLRRCVTFQKKSANTQNDNYFHWKETSFNLDHFDLKSNVNLISFCQKVTQQWLLSQPDSGLKFGPSESVNFIEKSEFRHREVLGPEAFQSLTERMDARQKNTFRLLGKGSFNNYVDINFPLFDQLPNSTWTYFTLNVDTNRHFMNHLILSTYLLNDP